MKKYKVILKEKIVIEAENATEAAQAAIKGDKNKVVISTTLMEEQNDTKAST